MKVIVWARVSSREQKEGYSIDAQLRAAREKAQKAGWRVVREFVVAESAKRGAERVAFNEMFQWVKANAKREKLGAILSHKLDRVCRVGITLLPELELAMRLRSHVETGSDEAYTDKAIPTPNTLEWMMAIFETRRDGHQRVACLGHDRDVAGRDDCPTEQSAHDC